MPKPRTESGEKNLVSKQVIKLRHLHHLSQRDLAIKLQLAGYTWTKTSSPASRPTAATSPTWK